ncbi:hypothetical protein D3C87_1951300 [compost metagenome]
MVPRADAAHPSTEAAHAEAVPAAGKAVPVAPAADGPARSFSSRVAAAAAERGAVRDAMRHPQRAEPTVRVPSS